MGGDERQTEQVLDLRTVDLFGPAPLELIESFDDREASIPDAAFGAPHVTHGELAIDVDGPVIAMYLYTREGDALILAGSGGSAGTW